MSKNQRRRPPNPRPATGNEVCVLQVEDLSRGGNGVAKDSSGRVIFIPFTAPGDLVKARITRQKSHYAQAELVQVLEPSGQRQVPLCPVFGRCGGCDWQHVAYPLQWQTKCDGVKAALSRQDLPMPQSWQEYPANRIWSYRNRIQLRGKKSVLGFYSRASHSIVPVERCAIAHEELNEYIATVREQGKLRTKPYKVELAVDADGSVRAVWDGATAAGGFEQINSEQNQRLRHWVMENISNHRTVLDLYGGSANLSAQLAPDSQVIHCVDLSIPLSEKNQWPSNISFHRSDVFAWVLEQARQMSGNTADVPPSSAIIDPPRGGMPEQLPQFIEALRRLNVTELIAVGCKTDTWARDLAGFIHQGWRLQKVAVFDFFPQTAHVESAALLTCN